MKGTVISKVRPFEWGGGSFSGQAKDFLMPTLSLEVNKPVMQGENPPSRFGAFLMEQ